MVDGENGVLVPREDYVQTSKRPDGYTSYDLPSNKNQFTLVSYTCSHVRITKFRLMVTEVCGDGTPVSITVVYNTYHGTVSHHHFLDIQFN